MHGFSETEVTPGNVADCESYTVGRRNGESPT